MSKRHEIDLGQKKWPFDQFHIQHLSEIQDKGYSNGSTDFQYRYSIDDTVTTKMIPESSKKNWSSFKFFYRSELTGFNTKENLDGHTTKLIFLYLEWSTEKPKLLDLKKTWQKAKISGFSKGWKEWLKLRIFLINKARSNWAVFNTKSQILIINLIRISDTEIII